MKLNEPIGNPGWGAFFVRVVLGGYLIIVGMAKIKDPSGVAEEILKLHLLSPHLAQIYASVAPLLAIGAGILLVLGAWTTLGAIVATAVIATVVYGLGVYYPFGKPVFNKDLILLAAAISLLYTGAGSISIDGFRKGG